MILPSPLVASAQGTPSRFATMTEVGMQKAAGWLKFPKDAQNVRPSHPPTPATIPTRRPTDCYAIDNPGRAHPQEGSSEREPEAYINDPSKLAGAPLRRVTRLVSNVRASTRTALSVNIRSFWCGRWASTRDQRAALSPFVRAARAQETNGATLLLYLRNS